MKKILFVLMLIFGILALIGAGYVIYTGGQASPGLGLIPLVFMLSCSSGYQGLKKKEEEEK